MDVLYLHVLFLRKSLCPSNWLDKLRALMFMVIVYHGLDAHLIVHIVHKFLASILKDTLGPSLISILTSIVLLQLDKTDSILSYKMVIRLDRQDKY
jgi:hypothetical protein